MNVSIDTSRCIGCGMCEYTAPGVFRIVGRFSTALPDPDEAQYRRARDAANGCPVNAISVKK
ncbi:MAG: ferredoxin [Oscillibacter sp.]|nr:ferredoxin [Oscillibacter sp.]